jgi:hypothetical protein
MEYRNELLDGWVGAPVVITYQTGPELSFEEMERAMEEPGMGVQLTSVLSRTAILLLVSYDNLGMIVKTLEEGAPEFFVAWGAVLAIHGASPEAAARYRAASS